MRDQDKSLIRLTIETPGRSPPAALPHELADWPLV